MKEKKELIINEILFWKENHLLPEHYCNFLLTLYSEGEEQVINEDQNVKKSYLHKAKKKNQTALILIISFCLLAFIFMSLAIIPAVVSITIVALLIIVSIIFLIRLRKARHLLTSIIFVVIALMLLAITFKIWNSYFADSPFTLISLIALNCISWIVAGKLLKQLYFLLSGILGIVLVIGFLLYQL